MCTRANRASVPDSLNAVVGSLTGLAIAIFTLLVAVISAPVRKVRQTRSPRWSPMSTSHIDVQVHSDDAKQVDEIERSCRAALKRLARTWAPYPLPLDRVEVLSSAPPFGKTDIYERWVQPSPAEAPQSLVVVSLGTVRDQRALTADEIAGALAGQIELLVADRYRRHRAAEPAPTPAVNELEARAEVGPGPGIDPVAFTPYPMPSLDNVTELNSVRALLADMKRSQPLTPAGSSQNGDHPVQDPGS
jgi:hypothetical protein